MIELSKVSKTFGNRVIFKELHLKIMKGDSVLICGPNGCGKSTLLKIIAGTLRPSSGEVRFSKEINKVGFMGHFSCVYGELTGLENLKFFSELYGIKLDNKQLISYLDRVGLKKVCYEKTSIFSRGMIQRLNIARLMLIEPDVYLLDEPETGLDRESKKMLFDFIAAESDKGKIVLWVSHEEKNRCFKYRLVYRNKRFYMDKGII